MTDKLQKTNVEALEPAPDYIKAGDRRGLEGITKTDMLIPRLALAQALSPQVTEGDPHRIEGLVPGGLFNSLTGQIYGGREPVFIQVLRKDKLRAMQFKPIEQGGGMIDPDVPLNDDRLKWGPNGEKPVATLFRDYLALLLPSHELIALSFKSSGIKAAKDLNGKIALRMRPIFAGRYAITTAMELVPKPHQIFKVSNAGWVSEEDLKYGEQMYEAVKDLDMATNIDRGGETSDVDDFDPEKLERESAAAGHRGGDTDM